MSKEQLAKIDSNPLTVPDFLKDVHGREGSENVTSADLIIPRLSICQSMTPQRKPDNSAYIKGLNDGDMFNTVTGEIYGRSVEFIPLLYAKSRILFQSGQGGALTGQIMCQSFNGIDGGRLAKLCEQCPKSQFTEEKPPECTNFMNFPSLLLPNLELIAASFKSTALKPARQFLNRLNDWSSKKNLPFFSVVFEVKIVPFKNAKGDFFLPVFTMKRTVEEKEFKAAQLEYAGIKGRVIQTEDKAEDADFVDQADADERTPF